MRIVFGLLLLAVALLLGMSELLAIADPAGTSLSNDADPFGPPAPWSEHAVRIAIAAVTGWAGARLLKGNGRLVSGIVR